MPRHPLSSHHRHPSSFHKKRQQHLAERKRRRRRIVAQQQQEAQPGDVSPTLKRRMGDDIAEMFEEAGRSLYKEIVENLKDVLRDQFSQSIPELDASLKTEGGARWQRSAAEFYRPWINDLVETIVTQGMNEAAGALEDIASSYAAEHSAPEKGEEEEGDSLIEVLEEEVEDVEEIEGEDVESVEEEEDLELEELLTANFPRKKRYRHRRKPSHHSPRRRKVFALESRREEAPWKRRRYEEEEGRGVVEDVGQDFLDVKETEELELARIQRKLEEDILLTPEEELFLEDYLQEEEDFFAPSSPSRRGRDDYALEEEWVL